MASQEHPLEVAARGLSRGALVGSQVADTRLTLVSSIAKVSGSSCVGSVNTDAQVAVASDAFASRLAAVTNVLLVSFARRSGCLRFDSLGSLSLGSRLGDMRCHCLCHSLCDYASRTGRGSTL